MHFVVRKKDVEAELKSATAWLTTRDLANHMLSKPSSVGRSLRRLFYEGKVLKEKLAGDRYGRMQWIHVDNAGVGMSFGRAASPNLTIVSLQAKPVTHTVPNIGGIIMQIEQGVDTIITEWVGAGRRFSAHEVTKELRNRANSGALQIDPGISGTISIGGKDVTKIEHNLVKEATHRAMLSGKFDSYDREHDGTHFEYFPVSTSPALVDKTNPSGDQTQPDQAALATGNDYDGSSTL